MRKHTSLSIIIVLSLLLISCSDDDNKNPTSSDLPPHLGVYSGGNSTGKSISLEISNISGEAWLTSYEIEFQDTSSGSTSTGSAKELNTQGLVKILNNTFEYIIGGTDKEKLAGTINGSTITGTFVVSFNGIEIRSNYTANKQ